MVGYFSLHNISYLPHSGSVLLQINTTFWGTVQGECFNFSLILRPPGIFEVLTVYLLIILVGTNFGQNIEQIKENSTWLFFTSDFFNFDVIQDTILTTKKEKGVQIIYQIYVYMLWWLKCTLHTIFSLLSHLTFCH